MKKVSIESIPFVQHVGVVQADNNLCLEPQPHLHNHLNTLHASAQFALAETSSGALLQELFPELAGNVIPVLRDSQMKFRKPATTKVTAYPAVEPPAREKFQAQFARKGRAIIPVKVDVKDNDGNVTATATFVWFIQRIE
jgi:acyl-coenzyme A thioesterase PaaI-like protein